jgi:hypothetical protein
MPQLDGAALGITQDIRRQVRNVSSALKPRVYTEYGVTRHSRSSYEVDHLVPLALVGLTAAFGISSTFQRSCWGSSVVVVANLKWATIATGGATVGLLAGWTAARRARGQPSSERLLDAAEAYVVVLRTALQCVLYPHDGEPRLTECRRLQGDLWVLVARIELLYGRESIVAAHAIEATGALGAVEVLVQQDARNEGDLSLREGIAAEEMRVEREYRAFLQATRAVIGAGGRRPAGTAIRARVRAIKSSAGPERRRDQRPRAEQAPIDEFLRDLEELERLNEQDAAHEDHVGGKPPAP